MSDRQTNINLVALCIWREARGEGPLAWRAVWHTILNRAAARFRGRTPVEVVTWPYQFSSMTAVGDGQTVAWPDPKRPADWAAWQTISEMVEGEPGEDPTKGATFYHAASISPNWADRQKFLVQIGKHKFYRG